ncbi:MAG TPA: hypothetical protein VMO76_17475 [Candidatus Udaeobacter sp.]|nr:hypothetical protein [Candidatus Udaeobacter sp.]
MLGFLLACGRQTADGQVSTRLGGAARTNASAEKTPAPHFDTLVVYRDRLTNPDGSRVRKDIVRRMR